MNHRGISPDEAIDRVLAGLREAEPLQGMQERVLRAAKERADARRHWILQLQPATTYSWAVAVATVAVIALAASWSLMHSHRAVREIAHAPAHLPSPNSPIAQTHLAPASATQPQAAHASRSVAAEKPTVATEPVSDEDALAISEMLAPSKPAPPLPLTHQEKLLAEVVHHGAPEELNSLRPDVRAREIEIAKAEFHDFFEPPALNPPPAKANQ